MIIQYSFPAGTDLEMVLATAREIHAECGMTPEFIELSDGSRVTYDRADFRRMERGELSQADYVDRHSIKTEVLFG